MFNAFACACKSVYTILRLFLSNWSASVIYNERRILTRWSQGYRFFFFFAIACTHAFICIRFCICLCECMPAYVPLHYPNSCGSSSCCWNICAFILTLFHLQSALYINNLECTRYVLRVRCVFCFSFSSIFLLLNVPLPLLPTNNNHKQTRPNHGLFCYLFPNDRKKVSGWLYGKSLRNEKSDQPTIEYVQQKRTARMWRE